MSEYTDMKKRRHKVIQTTVSRETKEAREMAEREIVEALFKIFQAKETVK